MTDTKPKCGQVLGSKHESTSREATQMVQTQVKTKQVASRRPMRRRKGSEGASQAVVSDSWAWVGVIDDHRRLVSWA